MYDYIAMSFPRLAKCRHMGRAIRSRSSSDFPWATTASRFICGGKIGTIERLVTPAIDNEEEGFGRNAGDKRFYYRIVFPMTEIWPDYTGPRHDNLRIEVFETWLESAKHA